MREVYGYNEGEQSPLAAEALVELGDWHLWHQKRESALEAYQQAWDEISALENGDRLLEEIFGEPVLLPDVPGANRDLTEPETLRGHADVTYTITSRGRVRDLELLATESVTAASEEEETDDNPVQLLRRVKRLQFRPRFENREPVPVENVRRRYAY
jgi:hypothetical protein